jgi:hypothetical protein
MKHHIARAVLTVVMFMAAACGDTSTPLTGVSTTRGTALAAPSQVAADRNANLQSEGITFTFRSTARGFGGGAVSLSGGGRYVIASANNVVPSVTDVVASGEFHCRDDVSQGPLNGCKRGEGVRWEASQLLASTNFKCTKADALKPVVTARDRVALLVKFFRAGDTTQPSFTAPIFVSQSDLAPDVPGVQNFWIQAIGCGTATAQFN